MVAAIGALLIVGLSGTGLANRQSPNQKQQSGVAVVKSNWRKGIRGADLGRSIFDQPPVRRNSNSDDPFQQMRQASRRMQMRVDGYYYSATIRNEGTKPITALLWDYTIANEGDPSSLTHHQFYNRVYIKPGKHTDIYKFAVTPPTRTVSAAKTEARLIEAVVVKAVQFKDGSIWKLSQ